MTIWPRASMRCGGRETARRCSSAVPTATMSVAVDRDGAGRESPARASIVTTVPPVTISDTGVPALTAHGADERPPAAATSASANQQKPRSHASGADSNRSTVYSRHRAGAPGRASRSRRTRCVALRDETTTAEPFPRGWPIASAWCSSTEATARPAARATSRSDAARAGAGAPLDARYRRRAGAARRPRHARCGARAAAARAGRPHRAAARRARRPSRRSTTRSCRPTCRRATSLIVDPMLATGGSAVAALELLQQAGARRHPPGLHRRRARRASRPSKRRHPGVRIYTPAIDRGSNAQKFILPGPRRFRRSAVWHAMLKSASDARSDRAQAPATLEHVADVHRAEQDSRARLSARRDDGPLSLRRGDLSAAHGRGAVAVDRPADGSDAGVVHRPRRHAAVDAGRAEHRDDRRAAARVRGGRACWLRPLPRRRHRELHAVSRRRASSWCARARRIADAAARLVAAMLGAGDIRPGFGHRFHTRDPRAARLFQMALELEVEGESHPDDPGGGAALARHPTLAGRPLPVNIDGAIAAVCGDIGHAAGDRQRAASSSRACRASRRTRRKNSAREAPDARRSIRRSTSTTGRPAARARPAQSCHPPSRGSRRTAQSPLRTIRRATSAHR